jgi:hypothetical protein
MTSKSFRKGRRFLSMTSQAQASLRRRPPVPSQVTRTRVCFFGGLGLLGVAQEFRLVFELDPGWISLYTDSIPEHLRPAGAEDSSFYAWVE